MRLSSCCSSVSLSLNFLLSGSYFSFISFTCLRLGLNLFSLLLKLSFPSLQSLLLKVSLLLKGSEHGPPHLGFLEFLLLDHLVELTLLLLNHLMDSILLLHTLKLQLLTLFSQSRSSFSILGLSTLQLLLL
jgi:hypothetical protein